MEDKLGTIWNVPFEVTLNTASLQEDVNVIGESPPQNNVNNGIVRDGGLTEVYQSTPALTSPSSVYHTSNGHTIHVEYTNHHSVYIDNKSWFWLDSQVSFNEQMKIKGYSDCSISSTGTFLCLKYTGIQFILDEIDDNGNILNTKSMILNGNKNNLVFAMVIDNSGNTFANILYVIYRDNSSRLGFYSIDFATGTTHLISTNTTIGSVTCIQAYKIGSGYIFSYITNYQKNVPSINDITSKGLIRNSLATEMGCVFNDTSITTTLFSAITFGGITIYGVNGSCYLSKNWYTGQLSVMGYMQNSVPNMFNLGIVTYSAGHIVITPVNGGVAKTNLVPTSATQFACVSQTKTGINTYEIMFSDISSSNVSYITQSAGASNIYTMIPDICTSIDINILTCLSVKNSSGVNALLTISNNRTNQGSALCSLGDIFSMSQIFTYLIPSITLPNGLPSQSGKILFRNNDGNFTVIRYGNDIDFNYNEISPGVVQISSISSMNIIDTSLFNIFRNCSTFINSSLCPYQSVSTSPLGITISTFLENKYSQCVDNGSFTDCSLTPASSSQLLSMLLYSESGNTTDFNSINDIQIFINGNGYTGIASQTLNCVFGYLINNNNGNYSSIVSQFTYIPSPYEPIPITSGYDFRNGVALLNNGSAPGFPGLACYDGGNFLLQKYQASFRLFSNQYVYDGEYIYYVPFSAGSTGTISAPIMTAIANGLRYLCCTPQQAVFLSEYDNTLFIFDGGRDVKRLLCLSDKPNVISAAYCVANEEMVVQTTSSLLFFRSGIISEIAAPYSPYTNYSLQASSDGVWAVNSVTGSATAYFYKAIAGGVIIPLNLQTIYWGYGSNRMMNIQKIAIRLRFYSGTSSQITVTWNWFTDTTSGTSTAVVTPTTDAAGYGIIDYVPNPAYVMAGSIGISSADNTQKKVLLSITALINPSADAQTLNHAL